MNFHKIAYNSLTAADREIPSIEVLEDYQLTLIFYFEYVAFTYDISPNGHCAAFELKKSLF